MQAAQTRRDILMAARRLFVERGYSGTTVNDVAEEAGVALQTVYSSVGPKPAIVLSLVDLIDEEAGLGGLAQLAMAETDPRRIVAWAVRIPHLLVERCGDALSVLMSAAAVEPDAAKAMMEGWTRHHQGRLQMARKLVASGGVRPGLTLDDVDAALSLTTWSGQLFQARIGLGWSGPTWERWCVKFLTDALLGGGEPVVLPWPTGPGGDGDGQSGDKPSGN